MQRILMGNIIDQTPDNAALTTAEQQQLADLESVVEQGLQTFFAVGTALATIRDSRLYREDYATFETYCCERWGLQRSRAYQLIDAAAAAQNVQNFIHSAPTIESHAAALARLPTPEQQREAWVRVVQQAGQAGKRVTAALVRAVVDAMVQPEQTHPTANTKRVLHLESDPPEQAQPDQTAQPEQPPAALDNDELGSLLAELSPSQADIDSREDVQIARNAAPVEGDELQQANETIARLQAQIAMLQGENDRLKEDAARAEAELQAAREVQGNARAILEEYREAVHRAGQYKPTSTRGEAVSPLLRCIERVWLLLQEK
jgi:hypothetical protein